MSSGENGYMAPVVTDYGTIKQLTNALGLFGAEDGASKLVPFHHVPTPSQPVGE